MRRAAGAGRLAGIALLTGAAVLLAGCAAPRAAPPVLKRSPPPPPPTARDFALLSTLGEESGIKVTAIDNIPLAQWSAAAAGRRAPAALPSSLGVWLAPGTHLIHVQYARNIESGISFTQGNLRVSVAAGRTYIVRPFVTTDFGQVSFSLIDHGSAFPQRCLPGALSQATPLDARGRRSEFGFVDIVACREYRPS